MPCSASVRATWSRVGGVGQLDGVQVPRVASVAHVGTVRPRTGEPSSRPRRTARRSCRGAAASRGGWRSCARPIAACRSVRLALRPASVDVVAPAAAGQVAAPGVLGHPVQPGPSHPGGAVGVVGGDHPALADRQVLRGVEAEAGQRPGPTGRPRARRRGRARRPPRRGPRGSPPPRRARPGRTGRRPSARGPSPQAFGRRSRPLAPRCLGRHPGHRVDVDEHGPQPGVLDRVHRSAERHRGGEHRRTLVQAQRPERELDAGGAGGDGDRVPRPDVRRELGLEAAAPPARW